MDSQRWAVRKFANTPYKYRPKKCSESNFHQTNLGEDLAFCTVLKQSCCRCGFPSQCSFANWCHKTLRICDFQCGMNPRICGLAIFGFENKLSCLPVGILKMPLSLTSLFAISWSFPCYYLSTLPFLFIAVFSIGVIKILGFAIYLADFQFGMNPRMCKFAIAYRI